jgi:hypothetical protein
MRTPWIVLSLSVLLAPEPSHADDRHSGAYQSRVVTAAIRDSAHAGFDIECRTANDGQSDVIIN